MGWIDVSRPLAPGTPVWPGDHGLRVVSEREGGATTSRIETTCHIGTHVDAPLHLDPSGGAVETIDLDRLIGPAEVVRTREGDRLLEPGSLPRGWRPSERRVLLRTDSWPPGTPVEAGFAGCSAGLVDRLAELGVTTLGVDTPSVDVLDSGELPAHRALMRHGMLWLEGLWLEAVGAGRYEMVALPLALVGVEAAPVRAVLRRPGDVGEEGTGDG